MRPWLVANIIDLWGRGEHVVVKPDELTTAVRVLTKEEDNLLQWSNAQERSCARLAAQYQTPPIPSG